MLRKMAHSYSVCVCIRNKIFAGFVYVLKRARDCKEMYVNVICIHKKYRELGICDVVVPYSS